MILMLCCLLSPVFGETHAAAQDKTFHCAARAGACSGTPQTSLTCGWYVLTIMALQGFAFASTIERSIGFWKPM
jgi:hypothetical protein